MFMAVNKDVMLRCMFCSVPTVNQITEGRGRC